MPDNSLVFYVVYHRPKDVPMWEWVIRRQAAGPDGIRKEERLWCVGDTLEEVRRSIPEGLHRMDRDPADHPVIVEVWF
jgi:hypothetical protein